MAQLTHRAARSCPVHGAASGAVDKLFHARLHLSQRFDCPIKRDHFCLLHFIREDKPYFRPRIIPEDLKRVLCVKGKRTNSRIASQAGAFLLFGHDAVLGESGNKEISIKRIAVRNKRQILAELDRLNINDSTVFPNIEKSATYIAEKFKFRASQDVEGEAIDDDI